MSDFTTVRQTALVFKRFWAYAFVSARCHLAALAYTSVVAAPRVHFVSAALGKGVSMAVRNDAIQLMGCTNAQARPVGVRGNLAGLQGDELPCAAARFQS